MAITINFKLEDMVGAAAPGASLVVTLCNYGSVIPRVSGTGLIAVTQITPATAGDGTGSFQPIGNDVILPGPNITFYMVQVKNSQGGVIQANNYQFTGSGTFDLSTLVPYNGPAGPSNPLLVVLTNPTGDQTIAAFSLITQLKSCTVTNQLSFLGSTSGNTLLKASAIAGGTILTLPAANDTLVARTTTDTLTNKTLTAPLITAGAIVSSLLTTSTVDTAGISYAGSSSGSTILKAAATASGTLTLPAATDTLVAKNTTDVLTNKTIDTAGANVLKINGTVLSTVSGSGSSVLLAVAPQMTNPIIVGHITIAGDTSGTMQVKASDVAGGGVLTLPVGTDTLIAKATTDVLTNKTLDTAGTGNHVQIAGVDLPANIGTSGQALTNNGGALAFVSRTASLNFTIDGGGSTITTGVKGQISIPANCTITGWVLTGDQSGSIVIDVLRSTFSGFPATSSIASTDKPTLASVQKNQNLAVSAWTTALNAGDQVQINVTSITSLQRANLTINVTVP